MTLYERAARASQRAWERMWAEASIHTPDRPQRVGKAVKAWLRASRIRRRAGMRLRTRNV